MARKLVPTQVGTDRDWRSVAGVAAHTCAIKSAGELYCWGLNQFGQLGDGRVGLSRLAPARVGGDADWASVAGGFGHTCAVKNDGAVYCWGHNKFGQLGDGTATDRRAPVLVLPAEADEVSHHAAPAPADHEAPTDADR